MRRFLAVACLLAAMAPATASARRVCRTNSCEHRVAHRITMKKWKSATRPYLGWLRSTRQCESGSSGLYDLRTTGNGFWFAYQHTAWSWGRAGGLIMGGVPYGAHGRLHPSPLEQDYRAVITLRQQGRGAWPVCG